jgi:hypothetical protein
MLPSGTVGAAAVGPARQVPGYRHEVDADGQRSRGHQPADGRVPLVRQRPRPHGGIVAGKHHRRPGAPHTEITPDDDYSFADQLGAKYQADLRSRDHPGESRVKVTIHPTRINAVDMRG